MRNFGDENNVVEETGMIFSLCPFLQTLWKWNKNYKENKIVISIEENKCTIRETLSVKWRVHYFQVLMLAYNTASKTANLGNQIQHDVN